MSSRSSAGALIGDTVNYKALGYDSKAFLVFSQHPVWVSCAGKPIENELNCLKNQFLLHFMQSEITKLKVSRTALTHRAVQLLIFLYLITGISNNIHINVRLSLET